MTAMDLGLDGRVFLVSGGSRGLGRASADVLVAEGARVVITARDEEVVTEAARSYGDSALGLASDNADPAAPGRLVAAAVARFGRLDGALISVGGPAPGPVMEVTDEQWRAGFDSIFLGGLRIARTVAGQCESGASLAFVLSTSVKAPIAGLAVSNGLRPGLAMAAKTLADELGPKGIRVNGLLPGRIATARTEQLDRASGDQAKAQARSAAAIPLRRYGTPAEFGRVAAFVLSPAASYLTGTMIAVDGGALRSL